MLIRRIMNCRLFILIPIIIISTIIFNEYILFYIHLALFCEWPKISCLNAECLHVFFISDTHILGYRNGHWLDKLKREWQMYRSYQSAVDIFSPDAAFFLGDLMDEGEWTDKELFYTYSDQFSRLFSTDSPSPLVYSLSGNHDIGFHYAINPNRLDWFRERFNQSLVDSVVIKGQPFILLTSMAFHGDECRLCHMAEVELSKMSYLLHCSKYSNCTVPTPFNPYRKPILLQHFPLYRKSDDECDERQELTEEEEEMKEFEDKYRERWETLSKDATIRILEDIKPRAVFNGHTHRGCRKKWKNPSVFWEYTVNSFSWRNGDRPSLLMASISKSNMSVLTCHLPRESTTIYIYIIISIAIILYIITLIIRYICIHIGYSSDISSDKYLKMEKIA